MKLWRYGVLAILFGIAGWYWWVVSKTEKLESIVDQKSLKRLSTMSTFRLVTEADNYGVDFHPENGAYGEKLLPETMGQGVAVVDIDGDDDDDLIFVNGMVWPWREQKNKTPLLAVYLNDGKGHFSRTEIPGLSEAQGYGQAIATADLNGDQRPDIFVTCVGKDQLFLSSDTGYQRMAGVHEGSPTAWSSATAFFDQDGDGDLDLLVAEYLHWSPDIDRKINFQMAGIGKAYGPPKDYAGGRLRLYENLGQGRFADASERIHGAQGGASDHTTKALALQLLDVNDDGRLDVFVANDTTANQLFVNDGWQLVNQADDWGVAYDGMGHATGAMGTDVFINDEGQWLVIGNFADEPDNLYWRRPGDTFFMEMAAARGLGALTRQVLTFGTLFVDLNLDGQPELVQVNGHVENEIHRVSSQQTYAQPPQVFSYCEACGKQWRLADSLQDERWVGRGLATGDFNRDGRPDLVVTQVARPPIILINQTHQLGRALAVRLEGVATNRTAIGARVEIWHEGKPLATQLQVPVRGYYSQSSSEWIVGLPLSIETVTIKVSWPDGTKSAQTVTLSHERTAIRLIHPKRSGKLAQQS